MEAGARGVHGVLVLRRVGLERRRKNADAILLVQYMAEGSVRDLDSNLERATQEDVQVQIMTYSFFMLPYCSLTAV